MSQVESIGFARELSSPGFLCDYTFFFLSLVSFALYILCSSIDFGSKWKFNRLSPSSHMKDGRRVNALNDRKTLDAC